MCALQCSYTGTGVAIFQHLGSGHQILFKKQANRVDFFHLYPCAVGRETNRDQLTELPALGI